MAQDEQSGRDVLPIPDDDAEDADHLITPEERLRVAMARQ